MRARLRKALIDAEAALADMAKPVKARKEAEENSK